MKYFKNNQASLSRRTPNKVKLEKLVTVVCVKCEQSILNNTKILLKLKVDRGSMAQCRLKVSCKKRGNITGDCGRNMFFA